MTDAHAERPFATLGVPPDADERTLRRAYAKQLKSIDQEREAEKFQELRQCYEWALQIAASRSAQEETPPPQEEPATQAGAEDALAAPHSEQRKDDLTRHAADARLRSETTAHAALDDFFANEMLQSADQALERLRSSLERPELTDLDARLIFEWGIASVLAQGWRPGHQHLFSAAMGTFDWRRQRELLRPLGRAGAIVNEAIEELEIFDAQPWQVRNLQRDLIRQLREPQHPGNRRLIQCGPLLERTSAMFPTWLHVVTCTAHIQQWQQWTLAIRPWRKWLGPRPCATPKQPRARRPIRSWLPWVLLSLLFIAALLVLKEQSMPTAAVGASDSERLVESDAPPTSTGPSYPPLARRLGLQGRVVLLVKIGTDGKTISASVALSSGHRLLDDAALDYARETRFKRPELERATGTVHVIRVPVNFVLENAEPESYSDQIRRAVITHLYTPTMVLGNPRAEVTLDVAPDGRILHRRLTQASGVAAWDQAVLNAVDRAKRLPLDQDGKVPPQIVLGFRPKP